MDQLAYNIANGCTDSIDVLDEIGERYYKNTIENNKCDAYVGIKDGYKWSVGNYTYKTSTAFGATAIPNTRGCGWWGRGVIQTTGPCNFAKLQHALNKDKNMLVNLFM